MKKYSGLENDSCKEKQSILNDLSKATVAVVLGAIAGSLLQGVASARNAKLTRQEVEKEMPETVIDAQVDTRITNEKKSESEKNALYETLRNEIISTQAMRTNLIVYMYSVYFLVFGYGAGSNGNKICFVVTFAVLVAFQTKICRMKYTIAQISIFIQKYVESNEESLLNKWEKINLENNLLRTPNTIFTVLSSTGAFQLGFLSLIMFWYSAYKENNFSCILEWPCPKMVTSVVLFIVCCLCQGALLFLSDEYKVNKDNRDNIETAFSEYMQLNKDPKANNPQEK